MILEPYHREFNLDYLKKTITNDKKNEKHRALEDAIDTIKIVNSLLMRLNKKEESEISLEPLSFKVNSYLKINLVYQIGTGANILIMEITISLMIM